MAWKLLIQTTILLEKIVVWVNKFIAVDDSVVQYDPGPAALPWAVLKLILRATINGSRYLAQLYRFWR
jgi:hypothetical protein